MNGRRTSALALYLFMNVSIALAFPMSESELYNPGEPNQNYQNFGDGEIWPWPWGAECPFHWDGFEGDWKLSGKDSPYYFRFYYITKPKNGVRYLKVEQYNSQGFLLAEGTGQALAQDKIIRAAMFDVGGDRLEGTWVFIRVYPEAGSTVCGEREVTAITLKNRQPEGVVQAHYLIEKVKEEDKDSPFYRPQGR
jgi:hypothetical protein